MSASSAIRLLVGCSVAAAALVWTSPAHAEDERWTRLQPSGPTPLGRQSGSLVYDMANQRMILFGGWNGVVNVNDLWSLDLVEPDAPAWKVIQAADKAPEARSEHTAIYDPVNQRLIVYGGWEHSLARVFGDVWSLDLRAGQEKWEPLLPSGARPEPRYGAGAVYDPATQRMILFGGYSGSGQGGFNDAWALNLRAGQLAWTQLQPRGPIPTARESFYAAHDPISGDLFVSGGYYRWGIRVESDAFRMTLAEPPQWRSVRPAGSHPSARMDGATAYDTTNHRILIHGGWNANERLSELWSFDPAADAWSQLAATDPPSRRSGHMAAFDIPNHRMLTFGGYVGASLWLDELWALDVAPVVPTVTPTRGSPTPTPTDTSPATLTPTTTATTPGAVTPSPTSTGSTTPDVATSTATPSPSPTDTEAGLGRPYLLYLPSVAVAHIPPATATPTVTSTPTPPPCVEVETEPNESFVDADRNPDICPDVTVFGTLPDPDGDDIYRVEVGRAGRLEVDLWNLPQGTDHDLFLYNGAYEKIAESRLFGTDEEEIVADVVAGRYYLRVFPSEGRSAQTYRIRWYLHPP